MSASKYYGGSKVAAPVRVLEARDFKLGWSEKKSVETPVRKKAQR